MHAIIAPIAPHIAAEYLQTNADIGYVVFDVDHRRRGDRRAAQSIPRRSASACSW
jgi:hypothetical protein